MKKINHSHLRALSVAVLLVGWLLTVHFKAPEKPQAQSSPTATPMITQSEINNLEKGSMFLIGYYSAIHQMDDPEKCIWWGDEVAGALFSGDEKKFKSMLDEELAEITREQEERKETKL